jgi:hypothetical protein
MKPVEIKLASQRFQEPMWLYRKYGKGVGDVNFKAFTNWYKELIQYASDLDERKRKRKTRDETN